MKTFPKYFWALGNLPAQSGQLIVISFRTHCFVSSARIFYQVCIFKKVNNITFKLLYTFQQQLNH